MSCEICMAELALDDVQRTPSRASSRAWAWRSCSYCYVYNKGDESWRARPALMGDDVFDASVARIRRYREASGQPAVAVSFHGGEPCLIGAGRFSERCDRLRRELGDVRLILQTNGTLLDARWARVLKEYEVGVSVDGDEATHDVNRVDHGGRARTRACSGGSRPCATPTCRTASCR